MTPGELVITTFPKRKSTYLAIFDGRRCHAIARFTDDDGTDRFRQWLRDNDGKVLVNKTGEDE